MTDEPALEHDYMTELSRLECSLFSLEYREKTLATEWISKLRTAETAEEKRIRNSLISYFAKHSQDGVFETKPFNTLPPPVETLQCLYNYLPRELLPPLEEKVEEEQEEDQLTALFNSLSDRGEFLSAQPVPRDGSFYIIIMDNNGRRD